MPKFLDFDVTVGNYLGHPEMDHNRRLICWRVAHGVRSITDIRAYEPTPDTPRWYFCHIAEGDDPSKPSSWKKGLPEHVSMEDVMYSILRHKMRGFKPREVGVNT
jgi:hypothetical protein